MEAVEEAGAAVGILGRNETVARQRAEAIRARGGQATALVADVLDEGQLTEAKKKMLDAYGKIDGLVNAAGGNMPEGVLQPPQRGFARTTNELYFGNPSVDNVAIAGPLAVRQTKDSPARRAVFICRPSIEKRPGTKSSTRVT